MSDTVTLTSVTISANRASANGNWPGSGGGLSGGPFQLRSCIIAGNWSGLPTVANDIDDLSFSIVPISSYNVIGTPGASGLANGVNKNQVGVSDAGLAPLADNGGPTPTMALLPGSPAIEGGNDSGLVPLRDQRGFARRGARDAGAFEFEGIPFSVVALDRIESQVLVSFWGVAREAYRLERRDALDASAGWQMVRDFTPTSDGSATIPDFLFNGPDKFYRVRLLP